MVANTIRPVRTPFDNSNRVISLSATEWSQRRAAHAARVGPWVADRVSRSQYAVKHPVHDFLFEYYSFRPAHLARWSPGFGVVCEGMTPEACDWAEWFDCGESGMTLNPGRFKPRRRAYLDWAVTFLRTTAEREPAFHCFGLHEWAMAYRTTDVRHSRVPLRLSHASVDAVVESQPIRCTHYDAFRFFTPAAAPLNRTPLTRATTTDHDQPGCIHANMDLYKFAFHVAPFLPAELTADAFELACAARSVDMRASPYDLRAFGYEPIPIETRDGRDEYVAAQKAIASIARPVRLRLLAAYESLRDAVNSVASHASDGEMSPA
jgi:hypothetical protein